LSKDKWLWSSSEIFLQVEFRERFGAAISCNCSVCCQIFGTDKSVAEDSLTLMDPKSDQVVWFLDSILFCLKKTLEHICQVTYVELIMEILRCLSELNLNISEKLKGTLHNRVDQLRNGYLEALEMLLQVSKINC
jgi:hypothetical protein